MIRKITGFGTGNGPIIAIHEGFMGVDPWSGFLNGADRLAIDQHPYLAFPTTQSNGSWSDHVSALSPTFLIVYPPVQCWFWLADACIDQPSMWLGPSDQLFPYKFRNHHRR